MVKVEKKEKIVVGIIRCILPAALFMLCLCVEMFSGCLNDKVFKKCLRDSDYGRQMENEMLEKQRELFIRYGLPEALADEIWEKNEGYLAFYQYSEDGIRMADLESGQEEIIKEYFETQGVSVTDRIQEVMHNIKNESENILQRYIYPSFIQEYYKFAEERKAVCQKVLWACIMICLVLAGILAGKRQRRFCLPLITSSFFYAAIWNIAVVAIICREKVFQIPDADVEYYRSFLDLYSQRIMQPWYIMTVLFFGTATLLWSFKLYQKRHG